MRQTIGRILFTVFLVLPLTACFVSKDPLIPEGAGVLPMDDGAWIGADDYQYARVVADGYIVINEDGPKDPVRFHPLMHAGTTQIYLAEIPTGESDGGWMYGVARRTKNTDLNGMVIQLALLDCSDVPESSHTEMRSAGWQISEDSNVVCAPPSFTALTQFLRSNLPEESLKADAWWEEQND